MKHLKDVVIFCLICVVSGGSVYPMDERQLQKDAMPKSEEEVYREIANQISPFLVQGLNDLRDICRQIVYGKMKNKDKPPIDSRKFFRCIEGSIEGARSFSKDFFNILYEHMREVNSMDVREEAFQS